MLAVLPLRLPGHRHPRHPLLPVPGLHLVLHRRPVALIVGPPEINPAHLSRLRELPLDPVRAIVRLGQPGHTGGRRIALLHDLAVGHDRPVLPAAGVRNARHGQNCAVLQLRGRRNAPGHAARDSLVVQRIVVNGQHHGAAVTHAHAGQPGDVDLQGSSALARGREGHTRVAGAKQLAACGHYDGARVERVGGVLHLQQDAPGGTLDPAQRYLLCAAKVLAVHLEAQDPRRLGVLEVQPGRRIEHEHSRA